MEYGWIRIRLAYWGWFNIKMPSYWCRKSHCGDKTIWRSSYLHSGIDLVRWLLYIETGPGKYVFHLSAIWAAKEIPTKILCDFNIEPYYLYVCLYQSRPQTLVEISRKMGIHDVCGQWLPEKIYLYLISYSASVNDEIPNELLYCNWGYQTHCSSNYWILNCAEVQMRFG